MTLFSRNGNNFQVIPDEAFPTTNKLPTGTYTVKYDEMRDQFYLQMVDGYKVPSKIYGDTLKNAVRILDTFKDRGTSTGILLTGEQGSGKTMLAKILSLEGLKQDMPTILINEPWHGENFNAFMQKIDQPVIVIFDEFEKVYDAKQQESMLTLLDGVYPAEKLYILTCNDVYRINTHMKNRPGRIFYRLDYEGLDRDFIAEYCEDNLNNKKHIDAICRLAMLFTAFNFDILKAMVEDMNRWNETPQEVMKFLNASPEYSDKATYDIALEFNGALVATSSLYDQTWKGNPLSGSPIHVSGYFGKPDSDGDPRYIRLEFGVETLQGANDKTGEFFFMDPKGNKLTLKKQVSAKMDWAAF